MIKINNLSRFYKVSGQTVRALDDVSLEVAPGEFVGIKGPSGSGKTTLLFSIGGLLYPSAGKVEIYGKDIYSLSPKARAAFRASEVGFVFQQFHLVPFLTVIENILAPLIATPEKKELTRGMELLERFNLAHRRDHKPSELSTGERQRTALARALLNNPKILLADEPTGNLDRDNASVVMDTLHSLVKSGCMVIMASHDNLWNNSEAKTINLSNGCIWRKKDE